MAKAMTERQVKLNLLKKFKESDKWTKIVEDLENERKALWNAVLEMYGFPDEFWNEFTETKKYNDKNKAIWACDNMTKFKALLISWEAEQIIIDFVDENLKNAEDFVRYAHWTSLNTFRSATDVEFTETDKLCVKANLLRDNIKSIDTLIETYSKEEKKDEVPTATEDNSNLE